jgi:AcrR family transcriptional regulator
MTRERRRRQVLQSAKEVFSKKGFHKASIADIIKRAGIARGTFYLYFKNKRHIFQSLLEALLQELDQRIPTITLGEGHPPPLEQLRANLHQIIALALEEPHLIRILYEHSAGWDKELDRALDHFYERVTERIEWALRLGIDMGLVRPCETRLVACSVRGGIKEVMGQLASNRISARDVKVVVDSLMEFGLRGVLVESV